MCWPGPRDDADRGPHPRGLAAAPVHARLPGGARPDHGRPARGAPGADPPGPRAGCGPRRGDRLRQPAAVRGGRGPGPLPPHAHADVLIAAEQGADLVFAPSVAEMYPRPRWSPSTPGRSACCWKGESRPGHFAGVLTVVAKMLNLVRPDAAVFGEKDAQQLVLVRRMAGDLELGVGIVGVPTVREPDGLALSSRNRYLSPAERQTAVRPAGTRGPATQAARAGPARGPQGRGQVARRDGRPPPRLDYLGSRDPDLGVPRRTRGPARLLVAARLGTTRLIDNAPSLPRPGRAMLLTIDIGNTNTVLGVFEGERWSSLADQH